MNQPPILERRRGLRFAAIVLWSGFLGAFAAFLACLALSHAASGIDIATASRYFLIAWALALVPAASAALLISPHSGAEPHGR